MKPQPQLPDPSRPAECGCHDVTGHVCATHRVTRWLARLLHVHYDRHWQGDGIDRFYECRCGARRVVHVNPQLMASPKPSWPRLVSKHGEPVRDTGWRRP